MKVFITGATGFIGGFLVRELAKSHDVTCLCRREEKWVKDLGCEILKGDVTSDFSIEDAEAAFHLAAIIDEKRKDIFKVNVGGTKRVVEECKKKNARLIYLSSVAVIGEPEYLPVDEKHPQNPKNAYERSKAEAEKLALSEGIEAVALRPPVVYGPNRIWAKTLKLVKKGFPIIGDGKNRFHIAYVKNVVEACTLALERGNGPYFIADPEIKTFGEIYKIMASSLGAKPSDRKIPKSAIMPFVYLSEGLSAITGKKGVLTKSNIERITKDRFFSIEKAKKELGYRGKYTLEHGFRETAQELREHGFI